MGRLGHPLQKNVQKMQRQPFGFQPLSEGEGEDAGSRFSATGEMIMKDDSDCCKRKQEQAGGFVWSYI